MSVTPLSYLSVCFFLGTTCLPLQRFLSQLFDVINLLKMHLGGNGDRRAASRTTHLLRAACSIFISSRQCFLCRFPGGCSPTHPIHSNVLFLSHRSQRDPSTILFLFAYCSAAKYKWPSRDKSAPFSLALTVSSPYSLLAGSERPLVTNCLWAAVICPCHDHCSPRAGRISFLHNHFSSIADR